jgi:hypothetical protein
MQINEVCTNACIVAMTPCRATAASIRLVNGYSSMGMREILEGCAPYVGTERCTLPDVVRYRIYWNETTRYSRSHRTYTPFYPMDFTRETQRAVDEAILTLRGRQARRRRPHAACYAAIPCSHAVQPCHAACHAAPCVASATLVGEAILTPRGRGRRGGCTASRSGCAWARPRCR